MNFDPIQLDNLKNKRQSKWLQVCPYCQNERIISYCQAWNIKKRICYKECRSCLIETGKYIIKTTHLDKYRKYWGGTTGKKNPGKAKQMIYQQLFNNPSKNIETQQKMRRVKLGKRGKDTNNWKGGKINGRQLEMCREPYKIWRKSIFEKDNYTCQMCQIRGGKLEADHIKEWCNYPKLRYEISNGRTLCKDCHKKTPNYSYKAIRRNK